MSTLAEILEVRTAEAAPELVERISRDRLRCYACGHECPIPDGAVGVCKVRFNRGGRLHVPWGYVGGIQCDPIEKKPFFHARPGALAFSFGMLGCDLHCSYCQNWVTSQALRDPEAIAPPLDATPEALVSEARRLDAQVVVSTYNEPLITSEWAVAIFKEARAAGLLTAYVSNGNGTPRVLEYIRPWVDLYKVDLKSFDDRHYRQLGGRIEPILTTIRALHQMDVWLEIVTLLIPGFNDSAGRNRAPDGLRGRRLARHPMARHRVSQGLPDERPGEHDAGDARARRGNRPEERPALRLRRQPARPRRRPRAHALSQLPRDARRAVRLLHPALPGDVRRLVPGLRDSRSPAAGARPSTARSRRRRFCRGRAGFG